MIIEDSHFQWLLRHDKNSLSTDSSLLHYKKIEKSIFLGGLAQLARAPALHAGGQRFESVILHSKSEIRLTSEKEHIDMKEAR